MDGSEIVRKKVWLDNLFSLTSLFHPREETQKPVAKANCTKKTTKSSNANSNVSQEHPPKENEIDALFSNFKKGAKEKDQQKQQGNSTEKKAKKPKSRLALALQQAKAKIEERDGGKFSISGKNIKKSRKVDPDSGLKVYTMEELQINPNSGGTPLCPFDCDCCH